MVPLVTLVGVMVAVNVGRPPTADGFRLEVTTTLVAVPACTVTVTKPEIAVL